ncbi:hypothetical protein [Flavobacterium gelatinilyticum]|uniref:hypothetical protein n=1 Tax=Flavobacterium gelatinilyticum TaxID=3003260 RepID=UPI00247FD770|nr:hypothetical protein [Flavobacterium gelatinilyticum]
MKLKFISLLIVLCSCTHNNFSGQIHDFDTNKPIKNVLVSINNNVTRTDSTGYFNLSVNSNSDCTIYLKKEGYANKIVLRKPDFSKENQAKNKIYMFRKDSDFSNKMK